ncbi:UDP-N-acetylmuramate dehydrogenase [Hydrogenimonas sp.]
MYRRRIDFSRFSSIRIGPVAEVAVLETGDAPLPGHTLVGGANNLLVGPEPPPLMMLGKDFSYLRLEGERLIIGAATPTGRIRSFCKKHDIGGFEFVAKLPGTLGGMLAMNAGVKVHETYDRLLWVRTDRGVFAKEAIAHGYRRAELPGVAFEAAFALRRGYDAQLEADLAALRANQPKEPSAGSAFKNPPVDYAGRLIEAVGLKGHRLGGMAFSPVHANFLVNLGGGRFGEAVALLRLAQERVWERFGIILEPELKIIHKSHENILFHNSD